MSKKPILTVDFGGTTVKYLVIANNEEVANAITDSKSIIGSHSLAALDVVTKFRDFSAQCGKLFGIAIAFNSPVKNSTFVRWGVIKGKWQYQDFEKNLRNAGISPNVPIIIINDAKSALYAELKIGSAKGYANAVMLTFGTAIGGGVLIEGKLVNGKSALGAELSNLVMSFDGFNFNKIQFSHSIASMRSLEAHYHHKTNLNKSGKEIFALYDKNDPNAKYVVTSFYKSIAVLIFNCVYAYGPEVIVIGGGLSNRDASLNEIKNEVDLLEETLKMDIDTKIKLAKIKNKAGNYGAYFYLLDQKELYD